jgi:hypothetical protein
MAGRFNQIAIPIESDRDRENKDRSNDRYKLLENVIYRSSALLSPKLKYFNFTTETEKKKFIKRTNEKILVI